MDATTLQERKAFISQRLDEISIQVPMNVVPLHPESLQSTSSITKKKKRGRRSVTPNHVPDVVPSETTITAQTHTSNVIRCDKSDTHWDYLLKEMKWLAADFQAERKRHLGLSKKMAVSATIYCEGAVAREAKSLQDAAIKQRKLAARIGRECTKKFWSQIHRVITYKQKVSYDTMRHNTMNQQLVRLVQQTEKYTALLNTTTNVSSSSHRDASIEQALANTTIRRSKNLVRDYARFLLDVETTDGETSYYGESTDDNSGSDATYINEENDNSTDDESTLRAAEEEECRERHSNRVDNMDSSNIDNETLSFVADPIELRLLQEEADMDIDKVLERMKVDTLTSPLVSESPKNRIHDDATTTTTPRHVQFVDPEIEHGAFPCPTKATVSSNEPDAMDTSASALPVGRVLDGNDADDDMDASDVDDYDDNRDGEEDDDEFMIEMEDVDDETTMEQEELLPRDIPIDDEIRILQQENELSVEELRQLYAGAFSAPSLNENTNQANADKEELQSPSTHGEVEQEDAANEGIVDKSITSLLLLPTTGSKEECEIVDKDSDEEVDYIPEEAVDDETTIEAEEKLGRDVSYAEELDALQREAEMSVDDLKALYARMDTNASTESADDGIDFNETTNELLDSIDDQENDEEFVPHEDVPDDESTLEAEDKLGPEMNPEDEIALLKMESERPIEELRSMHGGLSAECSDNEGTPRKRTRPEEDEESKTDTTEQTTEKKNVKMDLKSAVVSRPFLIPSRVKLREYQHVGLSWLVSLQSRRLNGILADEMGLGKTLQTISLLAYLAAYKGIWGPHLIVVPTSVILNWETELKRFCPALKVLCYYGSAKRRKELRAGWTKSNWYHVVITSYQLVVQDSFAFKRKRWYYLVLDEAQHIKNFQSQRWQTLISFNTQRRLLLTGTPLQNNLMELWSLLHFLMPYIFRSRKEFSYWFANPMNSMIEGASSQNDDVVYRLHGIIRPFILRRLKKDVETQMPGKFEHIIKCQLSRRQMFIYEEFMARSSTRQALTQGANFMGMMNVLMQLRKVCNHPDLFEPRSVVTPLVVDPIFFPMASCVIGLTSSTSAFENVSDSLICPLWCGSEGQPSFTAACTHDKTQSDELLVLEANMELNSSPNEDGCVHEKVCPALRAMFAEIVHSENELRRKNVDLLNKLNSRRCRASRFVYPQQLIHNVLLADGPLERCKSDVLLSYPTHLLAMRRDLHERADDVSGLLKRFVFAVPKADARPIVLNSNVACSDNVKRSAQYDILATSLQESLQPFREAHARLTTFFPDRKLVQFDAGKLQALAELLRERKHGGHKVLIFTQMSKMLDILEAFLNMNGHTYVRLDGGTSIDQRQRLMDRFNNDSKIFCFILSTRSGGTGVNLTGADTVVFYDSDWNPAQDAQAQDRAHRIGQTREVHIFRLVTEHTIEENILRKAKQKRNLDVLVMDRGNFDASMLNRNRTKTAEIAAESNNPTDLYTKGGLREIFGMNSINLDDGITMDDEDIVSSELLETTMTSLEDVDDANALKGSRKEAEEELKEFDESIEYKKDSDAEDDDEVKAEAITEDIKDDKNEEKELEKEIAAWQEKAGVDPSLIEASLSPAERYGLRFCEIVDPYYSIFAVLEYNQKHESHSENDDINVNEIEDGKAAEESRAFEEGDLLSTNPRPDDLIRQMNFYRREKARLNGNKKRRKLTGEDWEQRLDKNQIAFWYNVDTGEAVWETPKVILEMKSYNQAYQKKWNSLPIKPLINIMSFLYPFPDRMRSSEVCNHWYRAAKDASFIRHVYPVEMGAYTRDDDKMELNHYRTVEDAVASALPGDTIEFSDGHYWQNTDLVLDKHLKLVGDENNASNVTIEMSGMIIWRACGGFIEGLTFRRPKISSETVMDQDLLLLEEGATVKLMNCVLDNDGSLGNVAILIGPGSKGSWESVVIQHGIVGMSLRKGAIIELSHCTICRSKKSGLTCDDESEVKLIGCKIERNGENGVTLTGHSRAIVRRSHIVHNTLLPIEKDSGCSAACSGNFCSRSSSAVSAPPGFQFL